jgi:serine/threonine protein kinase
MKQGVKLLDFGIAKLHPAVSTGTTEGATVAALTGAHTVIGTPQYMAPEQIEGRDADARTDIFAFGCVLYELLTGKPAFDGKSPSSVMAAILASEPRRMRELQPITPLALERLVSLCLAKDPDERYQSAHESGCSLSGFATLSRSPPRPRLRAGANGSHGRPRSRSCWRELPGSRGCFARARQPRRYASR